jgi:hypothetical protein
MREHTREPACVKAGPLLLVPDVPPMFAFLLATALQVAPPPAPDSAPTTPAVGARGRMRLPLDSIAPRRAPGYASAALAALVADASARNRRVPPALLGYTARVESEIAFVIKRAEGQEATVSLEQTSNVVRWRRAGEYEQRVVGYRSTQVGIAPSLVGAAEASWTVPTLYGNRILLLLGADSSRRARRDSARIARAGGDTSRAARRRTYLAEHPLGEERDRFYTFAGGDTASRVTVTGRTIDVLRVLVEPRRDFGRRVVVFRGELYLDARRRQLVRMRGYFVEAGPSPAGLVRRAVTRGTESVAFVDLVNQEVDGAWWLPLYQRVEPQFTVPALGDARSVLRIVSRWSELAADAPDAASYAAALARGDTARATVEDPALREAAPEDTQRVRPHRLTFAPGDSIDRFAAWREELGAASGAVRAEDFDDVAPERWRPTGAPLFRWRVTRPSDALHFNRVEGLFTGYGAELKLRDAAPGWTVRANGGWAWQEERARGRLLVDRTRGRTSAGVRGGRWVELTDDFRAALDSGSTLGALLGADVYDYVDRSGAAAYATRRLTRSTARPLLARVEAGYLRDDAMRRVVREPPIAFGSMGDSSYFRDNRGVDVGRYARLVAQLELDPDMATQSVRPGVGVLLHAEAAAGELDYGRLEARVLGRRTWASARGSSTIVLRADGGMLIGVGDSPLPPQQLFEMGGGAAALPAYEYKEFAGDRALLGRVMAMHLLPLWRKPIRLPRGFALPGLQPGASVGWQSGWTTIGDRDAAQAALLRLAPAGSAPGALVARPTDGVKSSLDLRLRFFGGNVSIGAAKAIEGGGKWRFVAGLVQDI